MLQNKSTTFPDATKHRERMPVLTSPDREGVGLICNFYPTPSLTVGAQAVDVLSLEPTALEDPPELAAQAGYDAVRAVVRRPNASPVMVLALEHILESVYRPALPTAGEAQ